MANELKDMTVGVVGAGTMGRGIVQVLAQSGFTVLLHDASGDAVDAAIGFAAEMLDRAASKGKLDAGAAETAKSRMIPAKTLTDLAPADIVIEAIIEDLEIKRELVGKLDAVLAGTAVIASNTSSLSITAIAAGSAHPKRVAGLHFFNPVPLMKVAEVIRAVDTDPAVMDMLVRLVRAFGHAPVVTSDSPGFVVNHAGRGLYTEGLRIVQEGVADTVSVDRILREAAGFRMGPFELLDLTGLDVSYPVMRKIYDQFWQEPRFRPSPLPALQVDAGYFGRKTGRGFYVYENGAIVRPPEPDAPDLNDDGPSRIWLDQSEVSEAAFFDGLRQSLGKTVDADKTPAQDSVCLVAPIGYDATQATLAAGLDPARTLAVDPLLGVTDRLTLMSSPATASACRDGAHALLTGAGYRVTTIRDSPGFVAQRGLATIINIACDIAQQRIASPGDVDLAVTLGLGYPKGPLAWGDELEAGTVLQILDRIFARTGDPRYRASLWLRRRAELGLSLLSEEG
jgi:3-hydroxybutyryl-CoA dehydrogenase